MDALRNIPIESCYGVGVTIAKKFHKLNIHHAWDLLTHFPRGYENRSQIMPFSTFQADTKCLCQGMIYATHLEGRKRNVLCVRLKENNQSHHILCLKFFHFSVKQSRNFKQGILLRCYGTIKAGLESFEMIHPELEFIDNNSAPLPDYLIATYPSAEGLPQFRIRNAINPILNQLHVEKPKDDCFQAILQASHIQPERLKNCHLQQAIYRIHRPDLETSMEDLEKGTTLDFQRLSLEELTAYRLGLKKLHRSFHQFQAIAIHPTMDDSIHQKLLSGLSFKPTDAQQRCYREITQAMQNTQPMMHLLQGEVGSGKTLVATLVMLNVVQQGYKATLMVPTELLAKQHYQTLLNWLTPLELDVHCLFGKQTAKTRRHIHQQLLGDKPNITIGTHALFQQQVTIKNLALVVIDEQHRFGVQQRLDLLKKSRHNHTIAHQLLISATPIPRTLAMSLYGDLQQSTLDEVPAGRKNIATYIMSNTRATQLAEKIGKQCHEENKQAYWVCPFIEESEALNVQSATIRCEQLQQQLPQLRIGLIHGKLKENEKHTLMAQFHSGEIQILVATTVIEVGVDVPNASIIVVENAERMGLSQLHQLRGRVGRGDIQSQCIYLYQPPLGEQGMARLHALKHSNDGFYLAEKDLQMRGAGELIGVRQSGNVHFKIANVIRDQHLTSAVNQLGDHIHNTPHKIVEKTLLERWNFSQSELGKV